MFEALILSEWKYVTAATGGIATGVLAASGGSISLKNPDNQVSEFSYAGFGLGLFSVAVPKIRIPDVPFLNRNITANAAAKSFEGGGRIYMTGSFHGRELSRSDLQGGTVYLDAGTGILAGYGGAVMLLGIKTVFLAPWLINPGLGANMAANAMQNAPAVLVMWGQTEGLIASVGSLSAMLGYLH